MRGQGSELARLCGGNKGEPASLEAALGGKGTEIPGLHMAMMGKRDFDKMPLPPAKKNNPQSQKRK